MNALLYFFPFLFTAFATFGLMTGSFAVYFGLIILFFAHPVVDNIARLPAPEFNKDEDSPFLYNFSLLSMPFVLTFFLLGSIRLFDPSQPLYEIIGRVISTGVIMGAFGISIAHELIHRNQAWQRALGVWILNLVLFGHFRIEHVYLHHRDVGTPEDVSTARQGEGIYAFLLRHVTGAYKNSWKYENKRLMGQNFVTQILRNRMMHYFVIEFAIAGLLYGVWGWPALAFWAAQGVVAYLLVAIVNYIEHYGLTRKKLDSGEYEAQQVHHTWDSNLNFTNVSFYNLGLHSHHHQKAHLPFHELQGQEGAKVLPYGYSMMVLLVLFPPIFKKVMNPLLKGT